MQQHWMIFGLLILVSCVGIVFAVDRSKFRTCQDTRFCKTYRNYNPPTSEQLWHRLDRSTLRESEGKITAEVLSAESSPPLQLEVFFLASGNLRVKISEKIANTPPRWQPNDLLLAQGLTLTKYRKADATELPAVWKSKDTNSFSSYVFQSSSTPPDNHRENENESDTVLVIQHSPLKFEVYRGHSLVIVINDRNFIHYEQRSSSTSQKDHHVANEVSLEDRHKGKEVIDYGEDGLAIYADGTREEQAAVVNSEFHNSGSHAENFNGHSDTVPNGPTSVGIDFSFPCASHIYGIPEHSTPLALPTTIIGSAERAPQHSQPYRLYNLDVFEYELQETMALYGNIPFLWSHGKCPTTGKYISSGIFWFNPSESFVDISEGGSKAGFSSLLSSSSTYKEAHWISESGEIDIFILPGTSPRDLVRQFATLVGTQQLPPLFSLGYHQCRWNYRDERDVAQVNSQFEALDYPYDVIWLDIEHTNGKRYFTWDNQLFPTPLEMQRNISSYGRKMVTIIDPHIKRDDGYHIHNEATQKGLYIKDKTGKDFDGWCWPGSSSYLDFTTSEVRRWWAEQFSLEKYGGSTLDLYTWNDMNEPSVFNGPEVSMPKDARNLQGIEHREWHNLYGIYMQMATAQGQIARCQAVDPLKKLRPFVLTRAFWAGSQRYGAMWTGDNKAEWSHLKIAAPMILSINLAGLSFSGADAGGFFGDTNAELFTRWYQASSFTPFFRGHAHHDTKRKEPWVYGEPFTSIHRKTALIRYSLLPYWYSSFFEAYETGLPVMRALFIEFPELPELFAVDDQWLIGSSLLVKPVTDPGAKSVTVILPKIEDSCNTGSVLPWYEFETLKPLPTSSSSIQYPVELSTLPVFIRPGTILPRKMRLRRSSKLMYYDPYTLSIIPGACGRAEGTLYLDDETTFAHEELGLFALRRFIFTGSELQSLSAKKVIYSINKGANIIASPKFSADNVIERIIIAGQSKAPKRVLLKATGTDGTLQQQELSFFYDAKSQLLTIKKPAARVIDDWIIALER